MSNIFLDTVSNYSKFKNKILSIRDSIKENDLFLNEEHKLLCHYYTKIIELKKKLKTKNKKITFIYMKNVLLNDSHIDSLFNGSIMYKEVSYIYNIQWNDYNKKFINKYNYVVNSDYINSFFIEQFQFLNSLSIRDIYNLKYYTYHGDIYLNSYINNNFTIDLIKDNSENLFDNETEIYYFYHQFKDYFKKYPNYNNSIIDVDNKNGFINFIKKNHLNFSLNIYNHIFEMYLEELKNIFKIAPKTTDNLSLYRGISNDYITSKLKNKYYKTNQFTSTSIFAETAIMYSTQSNKTIIKIDVNKGNRLIYVEGITLSENDYEIIIPINSYLYLKKSLLDVPYYKKKDDLICPQENDININFLEFLLI